MTRPGMADGRVFTNYNSNCAVNNTVQQSIGAMNNIDYKSFVQSNSEKIRSMFTSSIPKPPTGCLPA